MAQASTFIDQNTHFPLRIFTVTGFDPASLTNAHTADVTVNVAGMGVNAADIFISASSPALTDGLGIVNGRVTATDTLTITLINASGGAVDLAAFTLTVVVAKMAP